MKGIINVLIREEIYWIDYKEFIFSLQPWGFEKEKKRGREKQEKERKNGEEKIFSYEEF